MLIPNVLASPEGLLLLITRVNYALRRRVENVMGLPARSLGSAKTTSRKGWRAPLAGRLSTRVLCEFTKSS